MMMYATHKSDTTLFTPSSTPLKPAYRSPEGSLASPHDALRTLPDSGHSSSTAASSPGSMPGTYHSDTSAGPCPALAAAKRAAPAVPSLRDRVRAAASHLHASSQHSAQAALRHAGAAAEALAVIESLAAQLERHRQAQELADVALQGAADEQAELNDVIADLQQQLQLEQRERSGARCVMEAHAAEVRLLQARLRSEAERADALQVRPVATLRRRHRARHSARAAHVGAACRTRCGSRATRLCACARSRRTRARARASATAAPRWRARSPQSAQSARAPMPSASSCRRAPRPR